MKDLNFKHLKYFFAVAQTGSITKVSQQLNLKPQTISGQLSSFEAQLGVSLFHRQGKKLVLSDIGKTVFQYAEEIFQLGNDLSTLLYQHNAPAKQILSVGFTDVIPKSLIVQLLAPVLNVSEEPTKLICREGTLSTLLGELALNALDLIIADQPIIAGSYIKAYTHQLAESGFTFFAKNSLVERMTDEFPKCLDHIDFLLQGTNSAIRSLLISWFDRVGVKPNIIAEFDDSALMKVFAHKGYGACAVPTLIEESVASQYKLQVIGRTSCVTERYYVISQDRKIRHPAVAQLLTVIPCTG